MRLHVSDLRAKIGLLTPSALMYASGIEETIEKYEIETNDQLSMFLAQVAHESGGFRLTAENLNYSSTALRSVFGKYFPTDDLAAAYHRQPERIANRVYASRMGNGPEESGDGWKFRGRGLIQLTGTNNYRAFSLAQFGDERLLGDPDSVAQNPLAVLSAGWFWKTNGLNRYADAGDIVGCTKRVNGGTHGLEDRRRWWEKAKQIFR